MGRQHTMTQFQFTPDTLQTQPSSYVPYERAVAAYRASQAGVPPFKVRGPARATAQRSARLNSALDGAYEALWLKPGAPRRVVKAAYRSLAARNHPDVGGDPAAMLRLNRAYETLRQTLG